MDAGGGLRDLDRHQWSAVAASFLGWTLDAFDFFLMVFMFKAIAPDIHPQPNHSRHEWAAWDAYINTDDPDSLYTEFVGRDVPMHRQLANTSDGLRAFEVIDNSGYVLCFGRPVD